MFKEMKDAGYVIDTDTYVQVMREFRMRKMVKDAVELFEHRMNSPFQYLSNECSLLLHAIASAVDPDLDLMSRVVKKYEAAGYCLLKSDYEGIHCCLLSAGKFDEAEQIIRTMNRAGYEPSSIIHKQLIFGLCKARRLEEAIELLDEMEAQGCIPVVETAMIAVMRCCCDIDGVDKAFLWFGKMVKKGFDADAGLLDVLVNGFLKEKRVIEGYQFLVEMVDKARVAPRHATLKNLIEELLGERRLEEALNLLRLIQKRNYEPDPEPFIQYISKFGSVEGAWVFLRTLSKKQSKKHVSVLGCQLVFQSFFNEGRRSEAEELFCKCPRYIHKNPALRVLFSSSGSSNVVAASA
ncbi:pentatricopeptide repeat-containing protein At3g48250, chloroplastic-like [Coffea eugenioides]|nr:pentatricopeptide repeat-containing protein At3g48250, chloroplastic-like [Coffea arabica]XP_027125845.1 pentatricopeptide repeat-containing protein At3g48250, chloroplastic-like [Coffea arabica]XP_027169890.1 pentatricopeptide repeat-containing protein At3g48250, chloroplastic-like [Coffea eugenioides]XP_027169891.1 pentatricopeptide repeat-containing protein At3g48250, chloroplastic-like [Coffea eugenioides]XP_027169892.1 pentatricopeptide repeat-containing protein At3g48250, chloroplastic